MSSLLDQSALTDARRTSGRGRAPRRRRCCRRGGDPFGVVVGRDTRRRGRGIRARRRPTMSACVCWSAGARRWCRPTTSRATLRSWPSAPSRWRASRPRIRSPALPIPLCWRATCPTLDLLDPDLPSVEVLEQRAKEAEAAGLAVKGVSKSGGASASAGIGGMVLVTSHGFRGAYLGSRHSLSMTAIAGEGTGMERDYDFSSALHAADLDPPEKVGRTAGERAVARLNPRKVATKRVPVVFDRRAAGSLVGHLARRHQRQRRRAQDQLSEGQVGRAAVRAGHPHHRRSAAPRGLRSRPFDGEGVAGRRARHCRRRRADNLAARLRDGARAWSRHHRACAAWRLFDVRRPDATNLHLEPGRAEPGRTDRRYRRRLLRHRSDRHRASMG